MTEDSVQREVRAAREAFARSHGFDVRAMVAELRAMDEVGDWPVVRLAARRPDLVNVPQTGLDRGEDPIVSSAPPVC